MLVKGLSNIHMCVYKHVDTDNSIGWPKRKWGEETSQKESGVRRRRGGQAAG